MHETQKIGFIGQGWVGKNYADDFEDRGFSVVRYALEAPYDKNKEKIATCDIVFIAVPTPTTPDGFSSQIVEDVLPLIGKGSTAVIKSTILPGTTERLQKQFPDIFVLHSPEFLTEASAKHDAAHPTRNIIGIPEKNQTYHQKAIAVLSVLPVAPYVLVTTAKEAELIKYSRNCFGYTKVIFMNMLYDMTEKLGADWSIVQAAIKADPMIADHHLAPVHKSGRGAGGYCFIKDYEAFRSLYQKLYPDDADGNQILKHTAQKNATLLKATEKDLEILKGVYGTDEPAL